MVPPTVMRASPKWVWIGLVVIGVGILMGFEGVHSFQTGEPIHTYRHTTMEWWEQIPVAAVTVLFGGLVVAAGLGWIKPRGERPM